MASKIFLACDHAGFDMKVYVKHYLESLGKYEIKDFGVEEKKSCDYPDFAYAMAHALREDKDALGIAVCGSGIGISIAMNKVSGVTCGLCHNSLSGKASRELGCNAIAIGGRVLGRELVKDTINAFLTSKKVESPENAAKIEAIQATEHIYLK